jgi:hypothetical protein
VLSLELNFGLSAAFFSAIGVVMERPGDDNRVYRDTLAIAPFFQK